MNGSLATDTVLIVVSIFLSAYFSATETSLTSLSELKVKHAMNEMGKKAKSLNLWLTHPNEVLNTILFGNNLVNIFASVMATSIMTKMFHNVPIAITTGVMTFLILVFGEIVPKTFAKHNALTFGIYTMKLLKYFYYLLFPITWAMNKFVTFLLRVTGKTGDDQPQITEDELEFLINVGEREGVLEKEKGEMLTNIFDISDIQVKEIMVPRIDMVAVPENISGERLMSLIRETEFSRIPVYRESLDNIIGILYVKDLIRFDGAVCDIDDVRPFLRKPIFVPETKKIDMMLKEFQKYRLHMAVVMDEYGGTAGIITMEDILEEIVGDIFDEYDDESAEVVQISDTDYLVDARMNIDDFCEEFGIQKTEDMSEYETLGGFVFDIAGEIPREGDTFKWHQYRFTVKEMKDRRLERIEVEKIEEPRVQEADNNDGK